MRRVIASAIAALTMLAAGNAVAFMPLAGYVEADCAEVLKGGKVMVALVFGQSNAGNFGNERAEALSGVYSFYRGRCYRAKDPLPGADSTGGSIWTRLGSRLVASGAYEKVLLVPVSKTSTTVADWGPDGSVNYLLRLTLRDSAASGITFTHLLWQQGESDGFAGTSEDEYKERFISMLDWLRDAGVSAPVYAAVSTRCLREPNIVIRAALKSLPKMRSDIKPGPDTDELGPAARYDGCHFNAEGLDKAAGLWMDAITAPAQSKEKKQ